MRRSKPFGEVVTGPPMDFIVEHKPIVVDGQTDNDRVLEEKEERIAPGTLEQHTCMWLTLVHKTRQGPKGLICLEARNQIRVDVTLQPEELEAMDNVLPAKYEETKLRMP
ncbi:hypothetical protein LWI28_015539 [Acer negundo]|uniref:Uncharacterized protein n=1 Tax=Acer negundo TaxID=4023 RepID=A0AAD5JFH1_ACENE|nr:hypothetical protein LWI28_015539 [Acer negundo]